MEGGAGAPKPLVLGRHDYQVRSIDAASGAERWNVTYGRLRAVTAPVPLAAQGLADEASACGGARLGRSRLVPLLTSFLGCVRPEVVLWNGEETMAAPTRHAPRKIIKFQLASSPQNLLDGDLT